MTLKFAFWPWNDIASVKYKEEHKFVPNFTKTKLFFSSWLIWCDRRAVVLLQTLVLHNFTYLLTYLHAERETVCERFAQYYDC